MAETTEARQTRQAEARQSQILILLGQRGVELARIEEKLDMALKGIAMVLKGKNGKP